ncbi:hypothetical protein, partial [Ensifer sp. SSB1]|uniref:hypothetical protein n=1 Tax=Ensifer sp. SSB1 TaxID=2795385 RepID=UPI0025BB86D4
QENVVEGAGVRHHLHPVGWAVIHDTATPYKRRISLGFNCVSNTLMQKFDAPKWDTSHAANRPHGWDFKISR